MRHLRYWRTLDADPCRPAQGASEKVGVAEATRGLTTEGLADLLAEFQQPGQPLHGLPQADAERIFVQVVEQLLLKAIAERQERRLQH